MRLAIIGMIMIGLGTGAAGSAPSTTVPASTGLIKLSRQIGYRFGTCVVSRHGKDAAAAILSNADQRTIARRFDRLIDGHCLKGETAMAFPFDTFRYSIADALFARDLAKAAVPDLKSVPTLAHIAD